MIKIAGFPTRSVRRRMATFSVRLSLLAISAVLVACDHKTTTSSQGIIPGAGAVTVSLGAAKLTAPPDAATQPITLTLARSSAGAPSLPPGLSFGAAPYRAGPSAVDFDGIGKIVLPAPVQSGASVGQQVLLHADEDGSWSILAATSQGGGTLGADVPSTGSYAIAECPPESCTGIGAQLELLDAGGNALPATRTSDAFGLLLPAVTVSSAGTLRFRLRLSKPTSSSLRFDGFTAQLTGFNLRLPAPGGMQSTGPDAGVWEFDWPLDPAAFAARRLSVQAFVRGWPAGATQPLSFASNPVLLSFTPPAAALLISRSPQDQAVLEGADATFEVAANAPVTRIEWQRSNDFGRSWSVIAGANALTLVLSNVSADVNGQWLRAVLGDGTRSATSASALLTVTRTRFAPNFVQQPASVAVVAGESANLTVQLSGTPTPTLQWQRRATPSDVWQDVAGATQSSLLTELLPIEANGAQFRVVATNAVGGATSAPATVIVTAAAVAPSFSVQPVDLTVASGADAVFAAVAGGSGPLSYQWLRNGSDIVGAAAPVFRVPAVTTADSGSLFSLRVSNLAGSVTSSAALLTVTATPPPPPPVAPQITQQPLDLSVTTGGTAVFAVVTSGTQPQTYQWFKAGQPVSGASSSVLVLASVQAGDVGDYTVQASNAAGTVQSQAARLTVLPAPPTPVAPQIVQQPLNVTVTAGATAVFAVATSGTQPQTYQWFKAGQLISGATSSVLVLTVVQSGDAGDYTVQASNAVGSVLSQAARLTVSAPLAAPQITQQPLSVAVLNQGDTASFLVTATGAAPLSYQWSRNGAPLIGEQSSVVGVTGVTGLLHCSRYTVTVTNAAGSVTSTPVYIRVAPQLASIDPVCEQSVHSDQSPNNSDASEGVPYELGMKFTTGRAGVITAIRQYKSPSEPAGGHVGRIWDAQGNLLASVSFGGETSSGWQQAALAQPLAIQAGRVYVVSVNVQSFYPFSSAALSPALVWGDLSTVNDGSPSLFGPPGQFPSSTFNNADYFRDVVFVAD